MSFFDEVLRNMETANSVFDDAFDGRLGSKVEYTLPNYPPYEVKRSKDGTLKAKFALAGFKKEDLEISFEENAIVLKTVDGFKKEENEDETYISPQKIRIEPFKTKLYVPESKYNFGEVKASTANGTLLIEIPPKEKREYKPVSIE